MLLQVLFLVVEVSISDGYSLNDLRLYPYGKDAPANGKLVHDMRTFVNVTFDWSSRNYSEGFSIPQCHEERLRRIFYEQSEKAQIFGNRLRSFDRDMQTGHLVYPLVLSVVSDSEPRGDYFIAAVHKLYAEKDQPGPYFKQWNEEFKLTELVISKRTWWAVWDIWNAATMEGSSLCYGGHSFASILPKIFWESRYKPQYAHIVRNYTDITSDVCGDVRCGEARNESESLTLAYSTKEGLAHLMNTPYIKDASSRYTTDMAVAHFRSFSDKRMRDCIVDSYRLRTIGEYFWEEEEAKRAMRATNCVFHQPYC